MRPALLAALLAGCGAAGAPQPPGPAAPRPPAAVASLRTSAGWLLVVSPPATDADGEPLGGPLGVVAFDARAECLGPPRAWAPAGTPLALGRDATSLDVAVFLGRVLGQPSRITLPAWSPVPPPPEAPLVFRRDDGAVEITWLPPADPSATVILLRDGQELGRFPASAAVFTDRDAPSGAPAYTLVVGGADYRTEPSSAAAP